MKKLLLLSIVARPDLQSGRKWLPICNRLINHRGGICCPDGAYDNREHIFFYQYCTPLGLFLKLSHSHHRLFAIVTILFLLALPSLAQKTRTTAATTTPAVKAVVATPTLAMQPSEMFSALNYSVDIRQSVTNNNAQLEIIYSPFVVGNDLGRIKSEANDILQSSIELPLRKLQAKQLVDIKYRYHQEFLPLDGSFNVMFIKPDISINPNGVVTLPTNTVTGQLKYRLSN